MDQIKRACAYIRVSDERQDEYSPDSQLKHIRAYAASHGLLLRATDVYYDDGISARSAEKRTAFCRMIAQARSAAHPYQVILVWKFSRFARNQAESILYKNLLRRVGVEVVSVSEPVSEDPFGALIERIIEWMDEYYVVNLSAEVRRGMAEKASRGEAMGRAVLGYDRTAKSYRPNDDAPLVRQTFACFAAGASLPDLAAMLARNGAHTARGHVPSVRWVRYLLRNPVYLGIVRWRSDPEICVSDAHPAIVPRALFDAVQERLASRPGATSTRAGDSVSEWPLRGLLVCSDCGGLLVRSGARAPSVQCGRYARRQCAVSHALSLRRAMKLLTAALRPLMERIPLSAAADGWAQRDAQLAARLRRITAAYQSGADSLPEYQAAKAKILSERTICAAHMGEPSAPPETLADLWPQASPTLQNRLLRAAVLRIVYDKSAGCLCVILRGQIFCDESVDRTASLALPCDI